MTATTYQPMRNARHDFDPMGDDWSYILDETVPNAQWRELVAVSARRATWPYRLHSDRSGSSYGLARLAPDWAFYSWGSEYVSLYWEDDAPSVVRARLTVERWHPDAETGRKRQSWTGTMVLDRRAQAAEWRPNPHAEAPEPPADVHAEAVHKGRKLLAFLAAECEHWRAGDQARPVIAADLYDPEWRPPPRDAAEAAERVSEARASHEAGHKHDLELCGLKHDIDGGLMLVHGRQGWVVMHQASGKAAHAGYLRLKRYAAQARAELLATGVDFTADAKALAAQHARWQDVYHLWSRRARDSYDTETGECYRAR